MSLELTLKQREFVDAFLICGESPQRTADFLGFSDRGTCSAYLKRPKILAGIAERKGELSEFLRKQDRENSGITRAMKIELLWRVCEDASEIVPIREGVRGMKDRAAIISAINVLNKMMGDELAPVQEVKVTHETRTEQEIRNSIQALQKEYQRFTVIDGEVER